MFYTKLFLAVMLSLSVGCSTGLSQIGTQDKPGSQTAGKNYDHPGMLDPSKANLTAPATFQVKIETTKGDIVLECTRAWSPRGADRFYNLVKIGYMEDIMIFRAIENFMFQFGIHGDPAVAKAWANANIADDKNTGISNQRGTISFAMAGPNTRTTQLFINTRKGGNGGLDRQGFTPFGKVIEGMDVLDKINTEYGNIESHPAFQRDFRLGGNEYAKKIVPNVDVIKSMTLIENKQAAKDQ